MQGLGGVYDEIFLPLHGEHQARNAALALAAVEAFFGAGSQRQLDIDAVRAGFAAVTSPGRLERVRSAPTIFLDAAHNPAGAQALAAALTAEFDFRKLVGVRRVMGDKDVDGILAALEPVFDEIVVTENGSPRAMDVDEFADLRSQRFGDERVVVAATLADASRPRSASPRRSPNRVSPCRARASWSPDRSSQRAWPARCSERTRREQPIPEALIRDSTDSDAVGHADSTTRGRVPRGVMAGTLILEAIVVLLAMPVVATVGGGLTWLVGTSTWSGSRC